MCCQTICEEDLLSFLDVYLLYSEFSVLCHPFNLQVTTFNCHGMKTSTDTINKMCNESQIILLQEHWLYPDELQLISQLNPNFSGFRISSMCLDDKLITGRPHGGIGIL